MKKFVIVETLWKYVEGDTIEEVEDQYFNDEIVLTVNNSEIDVDIKEAE